jgi:hypothetical protein
MKNRLVTIDSTKRTLTISTSGLEDRGYQLINGSEIILAVRPLNNNVTVEGSLTWRELQ